MTTRTAELLRLAEVAVLLGCSLKTVKRRIADGQLPVFRDGRLVRVRRVDLDRYIAERVQRRVGATSATLAGSALPPGGRLWD